MTETAVGCLPALLVFADDWGRHPSSCQHLIRHLLDEHEVFWINTIATRSPKLDWNTLNRSLEKVRQWGSGAKSYSDSSNKFHVVNPRMWPWLGSPFSRKLNRELLYRQLSPLLKECSSLPIAITTLPIVADLIGTLPVKRWVYYCVDDFTEWPGLDQDALGEMERRLVFHANILIAASETLQEKLRAMGRESYLLTHGVDLQFWRPSRSHFTIPQLESLQRPLVVFWGLLDRRMDYELVRELSTNLEEGTILLVGPQSDPDPAILNLPRVKTLPPLPYLQLPHLAHEAGVLIMPYADLPVTRAMQPLKLKEYLATGRPVVLRDLPATRSWSDCADIVDDPKSFSRLVRMRIRSGIPRSQSAARARLEEESWARKARALEHWAGLWS